MSDWKKNDCVLVREACAASGLSVLIAVMLLARCRAGA
jgi:hypothetical protein